MFLKLWIVLLKWGHKLNFNQIGPEMTLFKKIFLNHEFGLLISECVAKMTSQTKFQPNRPRNGNISKMALFKKIFLKICS